MVPLEIEEDPSSALILLHHLNFDDEDDRFIEEMFDKTVGPNEDCDN